MVAPVTEPLADFSNCEPSQSNEAINLLLVGKLADLKTILQSVELLLRLLAFVKAGVKECVYWCSGARRAAWRSCRRGGRRFGGRGRCILHFDGWRVTGGEIDIICAYASCIFVAATISIFALLSITARFAVIVNKFAVCGVFAICGNFVVTLHTAGVVGFSDISLLSIYRAGNITITLVTAVCISIAVLTTDTAHLTITMTTASKAKVDDTSLTASTNTASAPSPTPTNITVANDVAPSTAAAHCPHHHADAFICHQGCRGSGLHRGTGCCLGLWCDSQGHRSAANLDTIGHYRLRDNYPSLADKRSLQDMRDPCGSQ